MGMSCHVSGFRPPDDDWKKNKAVWDACEAAGVKPPDAVSEFFGWERPDEAGVSVNLGDAARELGEVGGYEIEIAKLPKGVKIIRVENSW